MDPVPEIESDAVEHVVVRPAVAPAPSEGAAEVPKAGAAQVDSGGLAETESLLGAVMAGSADGEAAALRRTLELDDRAPTAALTSDEQADEADALRRFVADPSPSTHAAAFDPTEQFEAHESALAGNPLARAIDANAVAQRAQDQAIREHQAEVVTQQEHVPGATDRATQQSGAAAATQFGAGRPPAPKTTGIESESEQERIERVDGLAGTQRILPVREDKSRPD